MDPFVFYLQYNSPYIGQPRNTHIFVTLYAFQLQKKFNLINLLELNGQGLSLQISLYIRGFSGGLLGTTFEEENLPLSAQNR